MRTAAPLERLWLAVLRTRPSPPESSLAARLPRARPLDPSARGTDVNQEIGRLGEEIARLHLESCGYRLVAGRFRTRLGEIDLVVERGDLLVFVEVKARRGDRCGRPEEAVTPRKLARIRRLASAFLVAHPQPAIRLYRFDVVGVRFLGDGRGCRVRHLAGIGP